MTSDPAFEPRAPSRPRFYFGAMSPYSWFAAERIGDLIPAAEWRPVFAGALFKAAGRVPWGLTARRAEEMAECEERAASYGLGVIRWPDPWPTSDLAVARAMAVADDGGLLRAFALEAMRLAFREGADLACPETLETAAARAGLPPALLTQRLTAPDIKARVRAMTDEAVAANVIGIPTIGIDDALFWGDDRLLEAREAQAGNR